MFLAKVARLNSCWLTRASKVIKTAKKTDLESCRSTDPFNITWIKCPWRRVAATLLKMQAFLLL